MIRESYDVDKCGDCCLDRPYGKLECNDNHSRNCSMNYSLIVARKIAWLMAVRAHERK